MSGTIKIWTYEWKFFHSLACVDDQAYIPSGLLKNYIRILFFMFIWSLKHLLDWRKLLARVCT